MNWLKEFPRDKFTELIASGKTEPEAMEVLNLDRDALGKDRFHDAVLVQLQIKRPEFREKLDEAKKQRADHWFNEIAKSVKDDIAKDEVPAAKLMFDKHKYLAAMDNPEKYSEKQKLSLDMNVNIFQEMKDLPTREVHKLLKDSDPFIEAEYENITPASGQGPDEEIISEEENDDDIFS